MSSRRAFRAWSLIVISALIFSSPTVYAAKTPRTKPIAGREDSVANTILSGRGAPRASVGVDGDFYIDVTTYTIYGPKKSNKWPSGVNLKGPQGEAGRNGDKGASGSTTTGSKGEKGDRGEKGEKGDKGEPGQNGQSGAQGPAGLQGLAGAQGPAGPAGVAGLPGATGATGPQGVQGLQGPKGDPGDRGVTGSQGPRGVAGPSNVYIGAITFLNSVVGSAGEIAQSDTFGTLSSGKSYQVDLTVYGVGIVDTESLPLKLNVLAVGAPLSITHIQWINTSSRSYRSGQVTYEHAIVARFAVNGDATESDYSLRLLITTGDTIMAGRDVTFSGSYRIQLVGSVM